MWGPTWPGICWTEACRASLQDDDAREGCGAKFEEDGEDGFKTDASTAGSTLLELGFLSANAALPVVPRYGFMMQRGARFEEEREGKKHRMEGRRKEAIVLVGVRAAYQAARWSDKLGGSLLEMAQCRMHLQSSRSRNKARATRAVFQQQGQLLQSFVRGGSWRRSEAVGMRPRRARGWTRAVDDVVGCPGGMGQAREKRRRQGEQCTSLRARLSPVVSGHRQDRTQGKEPRGSF